VLNLFNKNIPIGSFDIERDKKCVSSWYHKSYDIPKLNINKSEIYKGGNLIADLCNENNILLTGAPLKNLKLAMERNFVVGSWFAQGGFAGEGVVPEDLQLEKFKGMRTCPTYNLNGDPKTALKALKYKGIKSKYFISKNVCHRVYYDKNLHKIFFQF